MIPISPKILAAFVSALVLAGCGAVSAKDDVTTDFTINENPTFDATAMADVTAANNAFAMDLYQTVATQDDPNIVVSPLSISTALAMVQAGARGATLAEMSAGLHYEGMPIAKVNAGYRAILDRVVKGAEDKGYTLSLANRLWGEQTMNFLDDYTAVTRDHYDAELVSRDIIHEPEAVRAEINGWVESQTQGRIQNLFPDDSVTPDSRLLLANAIYFKGTWKHEFNADLTAAIPFNALDNSVSPVDMMMMRDAPFLFADIAEDQVKVLSMPYKGEEVSMLLVLPASTEDLASLEQNLSMDQLNTWIAALAEPTALDVLIPKFKLETELGLSEVLSNLGMQEMFTPRADLSGMNGERNLYVSAALHKAFIEVNEEGTEAAAATGISVGITSVGPEPQTFHADRPFLYLIRDDVTGAILFMGRVGSL